MLRRILLTATASAAALVAAVPAAGASPFPLPLPLPVVSAPARDQLTVTVSDTARTDGRYELSCGPSGGDHPVAQAACDRLDELAQVGEDPFAPVPGDQMCTEQMGGPETAHITGTWQGRRIDATFNRTNGCEISRWQTMVPVLPNTRS